MEPERFGGSEVKHGYQPWPDREITAIAARQRLVITHQQLLALGIGRMSIVRAVRRGRLHRVHHGVYALAPLSALPALAHEQAALFACGPDALISHHSAIAIWDLGHRPPGPVEVTIVGRHRPPRPGIAIHVSGVTHPSDIRRRHGLAVASPARAMLQVAPLLSPRTLERTFEEALRRRLTSRTAVGELLHRHPGRTGTPAMWALLATGKPSSATDSEGEERLLALLRRGGVPQPETQYWIGPYRADMAWPQQRLIVEYDGVEFHSGRTQFETDRTRQNDLINAGWRIIRITGEMLRREPEKVLVWIVTALASTRA